MPESLVNFTTLDKKLSVTFLNGHSLKTLSSVRITHVVLLLLILCTFLIVFALIAGSAEPSSASAQFGV